MTQNRRNLYVYGGGGHGFVVAEAASASGWHVTAILDDRASAMNLGPWRLLDPGDVEHELTSADSAVIVAVGDNAARSRIAAEMLGRGVSLATVVHPTAVVSPSARLAEGVFIGPRAVVHSRAVLEMGVIVNTAAVVEHDCEIGACSHIAPSATLCGQVRIGRQCLIGVGACVIPKITVGDHVTVGAGAAVVRPVPSGVTVVGVPAKPKPGQH